MKTMAERIRVRNRNFRKASLLIERAKKLLAEDDISFGEEMRFLEAKAWAPPSKRRRRGKE